MSDELRVAAFLISKGTAPPKAAKEIAIFLTWCPEQPGGEALALVTVLNTFCPYGTPVVATGFPR